MKTAIIGMAGLVFIAGNVKADECMPEPKSKQMNEILNCFHPDGATFIDVNGKWNCGSSDPEIGCSTCGFMVKYGGIIYDGIAEYGGADKRRYEMHFRLQIHAKQVDSKWQLYARSAVISDTNVNDWNRSCYMIDWVKVRKD
jgi:hypothetical protein